MTTYGDVPGLTYGDAGFGTPPPPVFGPDVDAELVVTAALRSDLELGPLVEGVSTELPVPLRVPWLRVVLLPGSTQADGQHEDHRLLRYRLNVETWDRDKPRARAIANTVGTVLLALPGAHEGGYVTAATLEGLPFWLQDPDDDYARYVTTVALHLHGR